MIWTVDIVEEGIRNRTYQELINVVVITIAYTSLISGLSGYANTYGGAHNIAIARAGLLGHGSGMDPNFAGLTLVMGIIMMLMSTYRLSIKLLIGFAIAFGIIRTVSLTTLGTTLMALVLFFFIKAVCEKNVSVIKYVVGATVAIILLVVVYFNADKIGNRALIDFRDRVEETLMQLSIGEYNDISSNRIYIIEQGVKYFCNQGALKQLLGGNGILVLGKATHNTYLEHILRLGILGTTLLFIIATYKAYRWICHRKEYSHIIFAGILTMKICLAIFIYTLAVNQGVALCFWIAILMYI